MSASKLNLIACFIWFAGCSSTRFALTDCSVWMEPTEQAKVAAYADPRTLLNDPFNNVYFISSCNYDFLERPKPVPDHLLMMDEE